MDKDMEFHNLKEGSMLVCEYQDHFTRLSRYALGDVNSDAEKQKCFLRGLNDEVRLRMIDVVCVDYQTMIALAMVIEMSNEKRKKRKEKGNLSLQIEARISVLLHNQNISLAL